MNSDGKGRFQELCLREGYLLLCISSKPGHLASPQTIFVSDKGVSCLNCWKIHRLEGYTELKPGERLVG